MKVSPTDRFWSKVSPEPNTGCWLWTAAVSAAGYGVMGMASKVVYAHRFSYELHCGDIPKNQELDHICRVRSCVNPRHLRSVSHRENMLAPGSANFSASKAAQTHCIHGHELSGDNVRHFRGRRSCRECTRIYDRKRAHAHYMKKKMKRENSYA